VFGVVGVLALIMSALVTLAWASPASGAKGGNSAITAAANDHSNPNADNQGNGNAPPNGSVGNADDKNPPGQSNGDKNRGYECDDNPGVGNGNPAHTGDCSDNPEPSGGGGGGGGGTTTTTTAVPNVTPTTAAPAVTPPAAEVLGETVTKPETAQPAELARTGMNLTGLLTVSGLGMVLLGLLLMAAARRQEVLS
jgi:hypothetical protein